MTSTQVWVCLPSAWYLLQRHHQRANKISTNRESYRTLPRLRDPFYEKGKDDNGSWACDQLTLSYFIDSKSLPKVSNQSNSGMCCSRPSGHASSMPAAWSLVCFLPRCRLFTEANHSSYDAVSPGAGRQGPEDKEWSDVLTPTARVYLWNFCLRLRL